MLGRVFAFMHDSLHFLIDVYLELGRRLACVPLGIQEGV